MALQEEVCVPEDFFLRKRIDMHDIRNIIHNGFTLDVGVALEAFSKICQRMSYTESSWEELCLHGNSSTANWHLDKWGVKGRSALVDMMESSLLANVQDLKFESLSDFGDDGLAALARQLELGKLRFLRRLKLQDVGLSSFSSTWITKDKVRNELEHLEENVWKDLSDDESEMALLDIQGDGVFAPESASLNGEVAPELASPDIQDGEVAPETTSLHIRGDGEAGPWAGPEITSSDIRGDGEVAPKMASLHIQEDEETRPWARTETTSPNIRGDGEVAPKMTSLHIRGDAEVASDKRGDAEVASDKREDAEVASDISGDAEVALDIRGDGEIAPEMASSNLRGDAEVTPNTRGDVEVAPDIRGDAEVAPNIQGDAVVTPDIRRDDARDALGKIPGETFRDTFTHAQGAVPEGATKDALESMHDLPNREWKEMGDEAEGVLKCTPGDSRERFEFVYGNSWETFESASGGSSKMREAVANIKGLEALDPWLRSEHEVALDIRGDGEIAPEMASSDLRGDGEVMPNIRGDAEVASDIRGDAEVALDIRGDAEVASDIQGDADDAPDIQGDAQVALDIRGDAKVAPDIRGDAEVAPDIQGDEEVTPDIQRDDARDALGKIAGETFGDTFTHAQGAVGAIEDALENMHDLPKREWKEMGYEAEEILKCTPGDSRERFEFVYGNLGKTFESASGGSSEMKEAVANIKGLEALDPWLQSEHAKTLEFLSISGVSDIRVQAPLLFSFDDLRRATSDFHEENHLRDHMYSRFYTGVLPDKTKVLVKWFTHDRQSSHSNFHSEMSIILKQVKHENIIHLRGSCIKDEESFLVYEYDGSGSLADALWERPGYMLDWRERLKIVAGIARGLTYLHDGHNIIHRDIKASNIFLDRNSNSRIANFELVVSGTEFEAVAGTIGYMAPEYVSEGLLSPMADVYSFGVLFLEIISGRKCRELSAPPEEVFLITWAHQLERQGTVLKLLQPQLKGYYSLDEVLRVMKIALACVKTNPKRRPTMSRVVLMIEQVLHNGASFSALTALVKSFSSGHVSNLCELNLLDSAPGPTSSSMAEELARALEAGKISTVRQLKLSGDGLGMSAFITLIKCSLLSMLKNLELSGLDTRPADQEVLLLALQETQMQDLQALKLHFPIEDLGAKILFAAMEAGTFAALQSLDLASGKLTEEGVTAIGRWLQSGKASKLTQLLFRGQFRGEMLAECWKLLANACISGSLFNLEAIDLGYTYFGEKEFINVAQALETGKLPKLKNFILFDEPQIVLSKEVKRAFVTAYKRNKHLTARLYGESFSDNDDFRTTLREHQSNNEKNVKILSALEDETPVAATYGKVFLCGSPRVGKTTLRRTLEEAKWRSLFRRSKEDQEDAPTRGIEVRHMRISQGGFNSRHLELAFWDLAGQQEYEVLHSAFLPDLALADGQATFFVIVCSANAQKDSSTVTARNALVYWLRFIASNSRKGISDDLRRKVMVVLNCFHGEKSAHDPKEWKYILEDCQVAFKQFLDLHTLPFILNARDGRQAKSLKNHLKIQARASLQKRLVPKICANILGDCKQWVAKEQNKTYPILSWDQYLAVVAPARWSVGKVKAATIYLHEAGHLILFRRLDGSREFSTDHDIVHQGVVILDPEWFCQKVIGHLLLPDHLLRNGEESLPSTYMQQNGSLPLALVQKDRFEISEENCEQTVQILVRLGLGYTLPNDDQNIFIPALIRDNTVPDYISQTRLHWVLGDVHSWVMGFSLTSKYSLTTLLPVAVLRKLQVTLAQDENVGRRDDSGFRAGISCISCRWFGMGVLVEYYGDPVDSQKNRLDILVRPLFQNDSGSDEDGSLERAKQVRLAQYIVEMTLDVAADCCPGLELRRSVIKPWRCADTFLGLEARKVSLVDGMKDQLRKEIEGTLARGEEEAVWTTNWEVGGKPVKYQDVLGEEDWKNVAGLFKKRCELTASALQRLHLIDPSQESHQVKLHSDEEIQTDVSTQQKAESHDDVIISYLQRILSGQRRHASEMHERFNRVDDRLDQVYNQLSSIADGLRKVLKLQIALNRHVQSLEMFTIAEKKASVPRFVYLTGREGPRSPWRQIKDMFTQETFLHFLCEAGYPDLQLHEVKGQPGIDIRHLKEWAQKLAPILSWSLKIAFVAAKIAGSAVLPGLGLMLPGVPDGLIANGSTMATGVSDLLKMCSESVNNSRADRPLMQAEEREIRGTARAVLKKLLDDLSPQDFDRKVGLRKVRIVDQYRATTQVVWVCRNCCEQYGDRAEEIGWQ